MNWIHTATEEEVLRAYNRLRSMAEEEYYYHKDLWAVVAKNEHVRCSLIHAWWLDDDGAHSFPFPISYLCSIAEFIDGLASLGAVDAFTNNPFGESGEHAAQETRDSFIKMIRAMSAEVYREIMWQQ